MTRTHVPNPWQQVQLALQQGRLPHAYIILGLKGSGKQAFTKRLAKFLLCTEPKEQEACWQCQSCHLFAVVVHPDFKYIERQDSQVIKVDQIREVNVFVQHTKQISTHKIVIIRAADCLHHAAANALLKTLEEPTPGTLLLLTAEVTGRIPATLRSRCQKLIMPEPSQQIANEDAFEHYLTSFADMMSAKCSILALANLSEIEYSEHLSYQMVLLQWVIFKRFALIPDNTDSMVSRNVILAKLANADLKKCYALYDEIQRLQRLRQQSLNQQLALEKCYSQWMDLKGA